jgi:hypothetical protein
MSGRAQTLRRAAVALVGALTLSACAPVVRPASFVGARDQVTDVSLLGPFDGQIVDANTGEPIREAVVVGVWSYDRGDGFIAPYGSETVSVATDEAGRYRIAGPKLTVRGTSVRLVDFHLVVYRRGYQAYRSDALIDGEKRHDFSVRHNRIELRKWRESDSHADHLLFLSPPPEIAKVSRWERAQANLELYERLGGQQAVGLPGFDVPGEISQHPEESEEELWLDARKLLPPEEVRLRTGDTEAFVIQDLFDLERTSYYHGVHLQASGRGEDYDVAFRVWLDPPDGLDPVIDTFEVTLPDVPVTTEVTAETWVLDDETVRAVAFIDREFKTGVLLTCGAKQCADIDTAIILAKFIAGRLGELETIPADDARLARPPRDAPAEGEGDAAKEDPAAESQPGAENEPATEEVP